MHNPYALLSDQDLSLLIIALSGYPEDSLNQTFALAQSALVARYGDYPDWFTPAQIAVCDLMVRYTHPDQHLVYIPWTPEALLIEQGPSFFRSDQSLVEISECLARSGHRLQWNRHQRSLEVVVQDSD